MTKPNGPSASPQDTVERALSLAKPGSDCVVIADEASNANLRWAGNTLTTNGVAVSRSLTVIAIDRRGDGSAGVGAVTRTGLRPDQLEDLVRAGEPYSRVAACQSPCTSSRSLAGTRESSRAARNAFASWTPCTETTSGRNARSSCAIRCGSRA